MKGDVQELRDHLAGVHEGDGLKACCAWVK